MRTPLLILLAACSHATPAPPSNHGGAVTHFSPAAGWTAAAGATDVAAAEDAIRGAAAVAIVQPAQHGDHCMNSVADAMTARLVEAVRGDAPATAAAVDRHTGFGATDGYLVAAIEPRPASIAVGDRCMGEDEMLSVPTPATIVAFVTLPDLDSARAEAQRLVVR